MRRAVELGLPVVVWTGARDISKIEDLRREIERDGKSFPIVSKDLLVLNYDQLLEAIKSGFEGQTTGRGAERR